MYARILLALALGLLLFAGEHRLLFAQGITIAPGPGTGPMQQQPQQEHPCQADFTKLRDELQGRGKALQDAGKRKATAKELCTRINAYSASEVRLLKFFTARAQECGIPPQAAEGLQKSQVKTAEMRTRICAAANNQAAGPVQSPTSGLSGAINQNTGAVPESPTGGGIFDTLSGNVLQQ